MGLFSFLGGGKSASSLDKHVARAKNKDSQSIDRFGSLEALAHAAHDAVKAGAAGGVRPRRAPGGGKRDRTKVPTASV